MEKGVFIFVVGLLTYIWSAPTNSETIWLKDVTTRFQTDKRTLSDIDLPNELIFHIRRGSDALILSLKKNHDINPNADVYFVRKLKDGRFVPVKTRNLENEDVAYYQDMDNGAFMTIRCVKRSNEQCDRVINGNIRIGERNYDLRPAETDITSRNMFEVKGLIGKRYVLQEHTTIQSENSVPKEGAANLNEKKVEQELIALLRGFNGQRKQNHFSHSDATLSSRKVADLHNRGAPEKSRQSTDVYYVEVGVLVDSEVWDLYSSTVRTSNPLKKRDLVKAKIREAYSHIMNGVSLRYKEIDDTSISISVIVSAFIFFQRKGLFPHKQSTVTIIDGKKYIDSLPYLKDLFDWDTSVSNDPPGFDQAILFTRYNLYKGTPRNNNNYGMSHIGGLCVIGERTLLVEASDYAVTVTVAAHELAHGLGADHDGEGNGKACKADDFFLMAPSMLRADPSRPYSRNPWIFSNCSVEVFKNTLKNKQCVIDVGVVYDENEWTKYTKKQPGEVYTLDEQCHHINGRKSFYCGVYLNKVCNLMRCTYPKTRTCMGTYFSAARGTTCGENTWCIEGRCVPKLLK